MYETPGWHTELGPAQHREVETLMLGGKVETVASLQSFRSNFGRSFNLVVQLVGSEAAKPLPALCRFLKQSGATVTNKERVRTVRRAQKSCMLVCRPAVLPLPPSDCAQTDGPAKNQELQ